jgi:uncharacterized protein YozE (UPF0346 family)
MDSPLSFSSYLHRRRVRKNAVAQFASQLILDHSLPNIETWVQFERYLDGRGVTDVERAEAYTVWQSYKMWMRRCSKPLERR